ncbi:MAG TPA: rRNA pseudouridine synthase [Flavobacteriales bacterium]|nr:rRNA pseudouridine synthase [Flavobacteriales bacterium]
MKPKKQHKSSAKSSHKKPYRKPKPKKINESKVVEDGSVRLNKFLANAGICSRREADELIKAGVVSVNGKIVTELGTRVKPTDKVVYGGQAINPEKPVYILLNKPKDYITTVDDPFKRKTVLQLIAKACKERVYPVGRLDRNTTGVLLLTNDGELTKRLTHPAFDVKKIYHVTLDQNVAKSDLERLAEGITLDDGTKVYADAVSYVGDGSNKKEVGLELHTGQNRVVRRMFEALGYKVTKLDRVMFAGLTKKNVPRGKWRFLTEKEVHFLKMIPRKKKE